MVNMLIEIVKFFMHIDEYLIPLVGSLGIYFYSLLFLIVFVETGLVIMPFLPGDSMIFVTGTLAAAGSLNVWILFLVFSLAAILGDTVNYWVGKYFGEKVFHKYIRQDYLEKTKTFYEKHGAKTIVLARFMPFIRTFAPFVAGVGKMKYSTFLFYNILGGIAWVGLFVFGGYFFGNIPIVKDNLTLVIILIISSSLIPLVYEYIKSRKKKKQAKNKGD